ncbi:GNAT family N-acetyltransferase [uncultured Jatrophihabitans sp.]|uniref:GNAT family N-acetyltransferase n=1 Tax=uncultured Jatrophihabitans sp. TaxID=1610747 RepID=UPI0035CCA8EB
MGRLRDVELADLELRGEQVVLRRWRADDADRVHQIMQDASMHAFLDRLPQPYTRTDAQAFVDDLGHEGRDAGTGLGSAVVERTSGRVVGAAALRLGADAEIGYWVAPDARGHGYAAQATRVLTRFAHEQGVHRIHVDCDLTNLASVRSALGAGIPFEGIVRAGATGRDDTPRDVARFARVFDDPVAPVPYAFPALPHGGLRDGVLALRAMEPADALAYLQTENDDVSVRWSFDGELTTEAQAQRRCARAGLDWLVGRQAQFAMVDVASGRVAGNCQLRNSPLPRVGDVGYAVHPDFRGRGYTGRALRLMADWAFDVLGYARLELGAKTDNVASQRAALAGGFEADGVRRSRLPNADGSMSDEAWFARLSPGVSPTGAQVTARRSRP